MCCWNFSVPEVRCDLRLMTIMVVQFTEMPPPSYGGVGGLRLIWRSGGLWERFFLLCPLWWGLYLLLLLVTSFPQSSGSFGRLLVVGFSFAGLLDAWMTPVFSSAVLRVSIGKRLNRDDSNARLLADYLDSLGQGGRWLVGNGLSLAYLVVMFVWGFLAIDLAPFANLGGDLEFYLVFFGSFFVLWSVYQSVLRRLLRRARQAGYPIKALRRT